MKVEIFLFFLFILLILNHQKSGYQNNIVPEYEPDDTKFMVCQGNVTDNINGQNHYKERKITISKPMKGPYTDFTTVFNIKNKDSLFYSPLCEENDETVEHDYSIAYQRKIIMDREDYEKEIDLDELELSDPSFNFMNPKSIQNKIIHDDEEIIKEYIDTRNHLIEDEEDIHTRIKYQRYFIDYPEL